MSEAHPSQPNLAALTGTGEQKIVSPIQASPSGESINVKLPINWKDVLPYFFLVVLGGDRIFSEYINAPADIREIKAEVQAFKTSVDARLQNIERALQIPSTQPSYRP